jgi:hypothetical protein
MDTERIGSPQQRDEQGQEEEEDQLNTAPGPGVVPMARTRTHPSGESGRNRSPTPPRALFRSTTGKGVAFTDEDVNFLVRFMDYRKLAFNHFFFSFHTHRYWVGLKAGSTWLLFGRMWPQR